MKRKRLSINKKLLPKRLTIGDLHLTDNIKDEYRWGVFPWIKEIIIEKEVDSIYILGDLTDKTNYHSSNLVNRIVESLMMILNINPTIEIEVMKGNHDFDKNEDAPYFKFLSNINRLIYISEPLEVGQDLFLPNTNKPDEKWLNFDFNKYDYVYMHTAIIGSKLHNGTELNQGLSIDDFKDSDCYFISGDIHIPQRMGNNFEYVGAPYPIRHGDNFIGGAILIDENNKRLNLKNKNTIQKHSLKVRNAKDIMNIDYNKGDQVKVEVSLAPAEFCNYYDLKKEIKEFYKSKDVDLISVEMKPIEVKNKSIKEDTNLDLNSDKNIYEEFVKKEKLSKEQCIIGEELL